MNTELQTSNVERKLGAETALASVPERLVSLDVFRGLVIVVMTLVNYLSPVKGVPGWAKHMPEALDGYTFVDVVFPAFLFMVGLSIPFALGRRLERGDSPWGLGRKIVVRAAALLCLGLLTVNDHMYAADLVPLAKPVWFFLALLCAVTLCLPSHTFSKPGAVKASRRAEDSAPCPPKALAGGGQWMVAAKILAALGLAVLLCLFRGRDEAGQVTWLQSSYWGMLGMIGWAYLVSSLAWLVFRENSTALMGATAFMLALYVGGRHGALDWLGPVKDFVRVGMNCGSNPATVMMGVLVANSLRSPNAGAWQRLRFMLVFGIGLYLAGTLVRPLHGINKSAHTEAYALVTGGICCVLFGVVYLVVEVCRVRRGWGFLLPLGQNALLAYLLPYLAANAVGLFGGSVYLWRSGWAGAGWAAVLTGLILVSTWGLTRWRIFLKL